MLRQQNTNLLPPKSKGLCRWSFLQQVALLALSMALVITIWLHIRYEYLQTWRSAYTWADTYRHIALLNANAPKVRDIAFGKLPEEQRQTTLGELRQDHDTFYRYFRENYIVEKSRFPKVATIQAGDRIQAWIRSLRAFLKACDAGIPASSLAKAALAVQNSRAPCEQVLLAIAFEHTQAMKRAGEKRHDFAGIILLVLLGSLAISQLFLSRSEFIRQTASIRLAEELARLVHDIRVPHRVATNALSMLLKPDTNSASIGEIIQAITDSLSAVQHLLDTAMLRISPGPRPEPVNLPAMVRDISAVHESDARAKGLEWRFYMMPSAEICVLVEGRHVAQILSNLLSNAVRYTEKGVVSLNVHVEDPKASRYNLFSKKASKMHTLVITVTDTGCGIPKDSMALLFKKFKQVRAGAGFGIGLFTVSRMIHELRGRVDVWSDIGKGTRFVVSIPVSKIGEFSCTT